MRRFSLNRIQNKYLLWTIGVLVLIVVYYWWNSISFGDTFPHPLKSKNIHLDCRFNDLPICCDLVEERSPYNVQRSVISAQEEASCYITKVYEPSPYEVKQIQKSHELAKIGDEKSRRDKLLDFMFADIPDSNIWLERVRNRMLSSEVTTAPTPVDWEYLSRFSFTEHCTTNSLHSGEKAVTSRTWYEWIEPLTVHMRHPFGFRQCFTGWWPKPYWVSEFKARADSMNFKAGLMLSDYVLLHSSHDKPLPGGLAVGGNRTATGGLRPRHKSRTSHLRVSSESSPQSQTPLTTPPQSLAPVRRQLEVSLTTPRGLNESKNRVKSSARGRNFFFDAGTSTFDSAMFWFICGYLQNGIRFDEIFGWEATLLEPNNFWSRVPKLLVPFYHFLNTYISAQADSAQSVVRVIKQATSEEDFVSLKLDIDTPEVEIPIVQQLLADETLHSLVDEFFFELHFRCEIMMYCGWRDKMPAEFNGLRLDRAHAMELFSTLRKKGIRAHVWP